MAEPHTFTTQVTVTINVSFTDTIIGAVYQDAEPQERREMLLDAIDEMLNADPPPVGRDPFVVYEVLRD